MYHLDAATFGNPDFDLQQTQQGQSIELGGNVGRTLVKSLNPTGAIPVNLVFQWNGETFSKFRSHWGSFSHLNFGADWFTMDLPLMLSHAMESDTSLFPYSATQDTDFFFALNIGKSENFDVWGFRSGRYGGVPYGTLAPSNIMGEHVGRLTYTLDTNQPSVALHGIASGLPIRANGDQIIMWIPAIDVTMTLLWNASVSRYVASAEDVPDSVGEFFISNLGTDQIVSIRLRTQKFQRYRVHVGDTYTSNMIGYNQWRVSLPVEVDIAEQLIISEAA